MGALETTIGERRVELVEQRAAAERAEATVARLEREGGVQAESLERLGEEHEAATRRAAEFETALTRAAAKRDGAVLRTEESVARAERAEAILVDANARSDRAEGGRAREAERHEHAYAALASARRIDVGTCHARIEQLIAALVETDAAVPEPELSVPAVEFQPGLALDGGQ